MTTPFRYTRLGQLLRSDRKTTPRDITVFVIVMFLIAASLAALAWVYVLNLFPF